MGENHSSSGKKKKSSYFQFSAQRVPEVTNTRSFSLGYNSSYFKPCYGHEATLSCHGSLCLRTCPGVTAQIKEQKSPSDQLGWGGTSPGEDKGRVTGSLVSCCHVCWQPQPQPGTLGCTAVKGLYIGDPQGRQLAQQMGLSRSHHPPPPWSRAEDTSYTPANVSPFSPCSRLAGSAPSPPFSCPLRTKHGADLASTSLGLQPEKPPLSLLIHNDPTFWHLC